MNPKQPEEPRAHGAGEQGGVVLFDGVCVLCSRTVRFIVRRDAAARFRFAARDSPAAQRLLQTLDGDPGRADAVVLVRGARCLTGADATLAIARGLGFPWPLLAGLAGLVPRRLRDAAYRFVAARRYRWFGRRATCFVPTEDLRARFLEEGLSC